MDFFSFEMLQWLFPAAVTLHNLEEAVWLPAWSRNAGAFHRPVGKVEFGFAVVVLTLLAWLTTWFSVSGGKQSPGAYLQCGYISAMLLNVFFPHAAAILKMKRYAPGIITAIFLNLPLNAWLLWLAIETHYVSGTRLLIWAVCFIVLLIGSIPLLFKLGRRLEQAFFKND